MDDRINKDEIRRAIDRLQAEHPCCYAFDVTKFDNTEIVDTIKKAIDAFVKKCGEDSDIHIICEMAKLYLEGATPIMGQRPQVSYICKERANGKICPGNGNLCSYEICHHTTDVRYAKNFAEVDDGKYVELDTWIPCSPGMKPKAYADVIFCDIDGEIYKGSMFDNGHWYDDKYDDPVKNVVAWMPLPEPYKKEGEQNDQRRDRSKHCL